MLILNFLPLALGYLLKCYKFHKQGFGEAWDKECTKPLPCSKRDGSASAPSA